MAKRMSLLIVGLVAAVAMLVALPVTAFAEPLIDVSYYSIEDEEQKEVQVDLGALEIYDDVYGYEYQKFDDDSQTNHMHIVGTEMYVLLEDVLYEAVYIGGDEDDFDAIWNANSSLKITTTDGPYDKYLAFTKPNLTATTYFYGSIFWNAAAPFSTVTVTDVPTAIALKTGSVDMADYPSYNADYILNNLMSFDTDKAPRLLWGYLNNNPGADEIGGKRMPSDITEILILS